MEREAAALAVGKLTIDLLALELALRRFLYDGDMPGSSGSELAAPESAGVGRMRSSDALTNPDSLGTLIEKFNRALPATSQSSLAVDPALASIKDGLAHGRLWAMNVEPPWRIVQFGRPVNGMVTGTFDEMLDQAWLDSAGQRLGEALARVTKARQEIHPDRWHPGEAGGSS